MSNVVMSNLKSQISPLRQRRNRRRSNSRIELQSKSRDLSGVGGHSKSAAELCSGNCRQQTSYKSEQMLICGDVNRPASPWYYISGSVITHAGEGRDIFPGCTETIVVQNAQRTFA
jgi:hypothetical protein